MLCVLIPGAGSRKIRRALFDQMTKTHRLRKLLNGPGVLAPGAFDAVSAKVVEAAGFEVVYMTGFGASASVLGLPDYGLMSLAEMVQRARTIAEAVSIPLIADADTGYGNPLNVYRTICEYEAAGVAGLHLEDQVFPKKCGHMSGKQVIPADDFAHKIEAAVKARANPDFIIIARTDARAALGLDQALERGRLAREAGADVIFIEAPQSAEELRQVAQEFPDIPLLANMVEYGKTPLFTFEELQGMGYRLVLYPISNLLAATQAMLRVMHELREHGTTAGVVDEMTTFTEFTDLIGLPTWQAREQEFKL